MTKQEVCTLHDEFCKFVDKEREYKEELLRLNLYGNQADINTITENLMRHDELIEAIAQNRKESILPILETLMKFVTSRENANNDASAN